MTYRPPPRRPLTLDNAPPDVLRNTIRKLEDEKRQLQDRLQEGVDERFLGWWLLANAATLTIQTTYGATLDTTGANAVQSIRAHLEQLTKENAWRAA